MPSSGDSLNIESGDFTKGAELDESAIDSVLGFLGSGGSSGQETLAKLENSIGASDTGADGIAELRAMAELFTASGYGQDRIAIDPSIVRGLDYYTGPVFEAELTFEARSDDGQLIRFGSVGGGGRYDGLVARFKGVEIPATGFSLGVSRLFAALEVLGKVGIAGADAPVIVLVMDREHMGEYMAMGAELRSAGLRTEVYMGGSGVRAQMKYADKRGAAVVVMEGEDERARGEVTLKDLVLGAEKSREITDNEAWRSGAAAQVSVKRSDLVNQVKSMLQRTSS